MRREPTTASKQETLLLWTVLGMIAFGIVMVYSASGVYAGHRIGDPTHYLKRQAVAIGLGVCALAIGRTIPYRFWRKLAYPMVAASLLSLLLVLLYGSSAGGATRWFRFGGFSFQPSEWARFALVIYLSAMLAKKGDKIRTFAFGFLPALMITAIFSGLILLQPDMGTAVTIMAVTLIMLFAGGGRVGYLLGFIPLGAAAFAYLVIQAPYRLQRVLAFLDPDKYATGSSYHLLQSMLALGSGGPLGLGLGMSRQKLGFLPEAHTDFIMAIVGEELGLVGALTLLTAFAIFVGVGIRCAFVLKEPFGRALALGITLAIGLSALINMAVVAGLLPTKGLVLPFISYGGSAMLVNAFFAGVLMNIVREADVNLEDG